MACRNRLLTHPGFCLAYCRRASRKEIHPSGGHGNRRYQVRINSKTASAAFNSGKATAIIIMKNNTASCAKCWGASFAK